MAQGYDHALARFLLFGVAGWALENWLWPRDNGGQGRYSKLFGGYKVPLLPVYGLGGVLLGPAAAKREGGVAKFVTYAAAFTGVELIAGAFDRRDGKPSWDYDGSPVDWKHTVAWGALGMTAESVLKDVKPGALTGSLALMGLRTMTKL